MPTSFLLRPPDSSQLFGTATQGGWLDKDRYVCPIEDGNWRGRRRWTEMFVELKHNKREEMIVWTIGDCLMHQSLLAEFQTRGFTGLRSLPAKVRFRDVFVSEEYREIVVTGWAGLPHKNSGVERVAVCSECRCQKYASRGRPEQIVDWSQWTGDHFFRVWPWSKIIFIVDEVAEFLKKAKVRSFDLFRPEELGGLGRAGTVTTPPLSDVLPADLAARYESTLHLA
jgi:hypothetical protein